MLTFLAYISFIIIGLLFSYISIIYFDTLHPIECRFIYRSVNTSPLTTPQEKIGKAQLLNRGYHMVSSEFRW